ncbi:DUF397 domain-containing protein [Actinomadura monticuli]|uniref:DUF397 domain-containing protein n=1 Tax=Actinomadura monticuli TaxID=3097367 RepID=A0ABV4QIR8_9ACTN
MPGFKVVTPHSDSRIGGPGPLEGEGVDRAERPRVTWRKSRRSAGGDCVEIAFDGASVLMRDSKDPLGTVLTIPVAQWRILRCSIAGGYGDHPE